MSAGTSLHYLLNATQFLTTCAFIFRDGKLFGSA